MEIAARIFEPHLSHDVRNILGYEEIPRLVSQVREGGGTSVLVIGNSLARACIDGEVLQQELKAKGYAEPKVIYMTPDATGISEWAMAYRKWFPEGERGADITLVVTGPSHLLDLPIRSPEKIAAYHTSSRDRMRVVSDWIDGTNPRVRFLLASVSRLFATRERIRPLLFYNTVPGYESTAQRINSTSRGTGEVEASERKVSALRLGLLLDSMASSPDCKYVVAAALPDPFEIPESVKKMASSRGAEMIEEGCEMTWQSDAFPDGYHLAPKYAGEFTRAVAARIFPRGDTRSLPQSRNAD